MSTEQTPTPSTTNASSGTTTHLPFTVPASLQHYLIPDATWLANNPPFVKLAVGGLVFHKDHLLFIQRAATDSIPNVWEYPGGACESPPVDPTILHGVAREVHEETGLTVTRFVRQVGGIHSWPEKTGPPRWAKLSFEVEVAEMKGGVEMGEAERKGVLGAEEEGVCRVKLDEKEHQRYLWVTEEELRKGYVDGEKIEVWDEPNRNLALAGFAGRKEGEKTEE